MHIHRVFTQIWITFIQAATQDDGLDISDDDLSELFAIDRETWLAEADATSEFFESFDGRVPAAVTKQLDILRSKLA